MTEQDRSFHNGIFTGIVLSSICLAILYLGFQIGYQGGVGSVREEALLLGIAEEENGVFEWVEDSKQDHLISENATPVSQMD